jgi:hypothetical protein
VDAPETGTDPGGEAGALIDTEPGGEEAPAFGFPEFPHPVPAASNVSEMPAAEIPIVERGIFLEVFMASKRIGFGVLAALHADASLTCPGQRERSARRCGGGH